MKNAPLPPSRRQELCQAVIRVPGDFVSWDDAPAAALIAAKPDMLLYAEIFIL